MTRKTKSTRVFLTLIAVLFVLLIGWREILDFLADLIFFREVGFAAVFSRTVTAKLLTGVAFAFTAFLLLYGNLQIALRRRLPPTAMHLLFERMPQLRQIDLGRLLSWGALFLSLFAAVLAFAGGAAFWKETLLFLKSGPAGVTDPLFGKDISFYLFSYPFINDVNDVARGLLFISFLLTGLVYLLRGGMTVVGRSVHVEAGVKRHLAVLAALFLLSLSAGFLLDRYGLLTTEHGVLYGASYTDVHVRMTMLAVTAAFSAAAAVVVLAGTAGRSLAVPIVAVAVLAAVSLLGLKLYPELVQSFKVAPNEIVLERPYIENHIRFTRYGYGLENIDLQPFAADQSLTYADIRHNVSTIRNIRLWDEEPLLKTYSQLQQIRTYYRFGDVDNDRYTINGASTQVMLSPRELSYADLPGKSWINERLVFTHGFGLALGPVSGITKEGLPEFYVKDIPPVTLAGPKVSRPEIYYGEHPNDYVIVKTKTKEFGYPTTEGNVYTVYDGDGGVRLSSFASRILYAAYFGNFKILLSSDITPDSRILYYRSIMKRVSTIAPFLSYDPDPYLVVRDDGRLSWIIDAYTYTANLPYSKPIRQGINYIRNPVKVVVDAYNGSVAFYVVDPSDIMIKTYRAVFPSLFRPASEMPPDIRKHIRYPRALLSIQARMFTSFHMTDPSVFYNKEDLWEVPSFRGETMDPYYLIMKLPRGKGEEFVLLLPFTPSKRDNLAAWMAAECDGDNYGKIVVYTFPRDRLVFGPRQIDARIDQDAYISQQLTLWGQRGSDVIRGSLLIIPIENSLLYVQPLYLVATDRVGLPELRRVIVAYGNNVVMEETLDAAIERLFKGALPEPQPVAAGAAAAVTGSTPRELGKQALEQLQKAREALRRENWQEFGKRLKEAEKTLEKIGR